MRSEALTEFAGAKINLSLRITAKRADGYHLLESLVVHTSELGDTLHAVPHRALRLETSGPYGAALGGDEDNLVLRAAHHLGVDQGAHISLVKSLPVSSGIGGGSADAAAALRLLNRLWGLGHSTHSLRSIGAALGADVPMCVSPVPAFVTGIGENVAPVRIPALHMVLANPGVPVETPAVFQRRSGPFSQAMEPPAAFPTLEQVVRFVQAAGNDLYAPACALAPVIGTVKTALAQANHCLCAAMSGSGATCFGLFATRARAESAALALSRAYPQWWVRAATTQESRHDE